MTGAPARRRRSEGRRKMLVSEILAIKGKVLFTISPNKPLSEAVAIMTEQDVGSLVVFDKGRMAGLLTFREVLVATQKTGANWQSMPIEDAMLKDPVAAAVNMEMDELRRRQDMTKRMGGADKVKRQHDGGRLTIRERMIEEAAGITRLIDKLEASGLVRRDRGRDRPRAGHGLRHRHPPGQRDDARRGADGSRRDRHRAHARAALPDHHGDRTDVGIDCAEHG